MSLAEDLALPQPTQNQSAQPATPPVQGNLAKDLGLSPPDQADNAVRSEIGFDPSEAMEFYKKSAKGLPHNLMEGAGQVLDMFDAASGASDYPIQAGHGPDLQHKEHPMYQAIAGEVADRLGLPPSAEDTPGQRITSAIQRGVPGAAIMGPDAVIPGILSSGASQAAAEAHAPPWAQFAAGAVAGASPALGAGLVRQAGRGSLADAANMQNQEATFQKAGITPTGPQVGTSGKSNAATLANQSNEAQASVGRTSKQFAAQGSDGSFLEAQHGNPPPEMRPTTNVEGGAAIDNGVKVYRKQQAVDETRAFQNARSLIGGDTKMAGDNFLKTGQDVIHPTGDAEIDQWLVRPKVEGLVKATEKAGQPTPSTILDSNGNPLQNPPTGFTYDQLRNMRSRLGNMIDWSMTPTQPGQNRDWKRLYNALGDDLAAGVSKAPPAAQTAYRQATSLYKTNQNQREILEKVTDQIGGPENAGAKIYKAATQGLVDDPGTLRTVLGAMSPAEQGTVKSALTDRLGYPKGATDRPWNENTFRDNYQNLHPEVKDMVYGPRGTPIRDKMEAVNDVLNLRKMRGENQSGLAEGVERGGNAALGKTAVGVAATAGTLIGSHFMPFIHQLAEHPVLATVGATVAGSGLAWRSAMNRVVNSPAGRNWLARATKVPYGALPQMFNQLEQMGQTGQDIKQAIHGEDSNGN